MNQETKEGKQENITSPPSLSSSPSHEFSFTVLSLHHTQNESKSSVSSIDLSPADEIFFHGHLLPLHLISHLPHSPPRASTNSLDNFTLPITQPLHDHNPNNNENATKGTTVKPKSFSLFGLPKWRKGCEVNEKDDIGRCKKKPKFDVSYLVKKYTRALMSFRGRKSSTEQYYRHQSYSCSDFSNSRLGGRKELLRGRFSAPASMRTSPTNSGLIEKRFGKMMNNPSIVLEKRLFVAILIAVIVTGTLTIISLSRSASNTTTTSIFCTFVNSYAQGGINAFDDTVITPTQYTAILHYATSSVVPQQTALEIAVTLDLLRSIGPCNFLIFGLGHDSLMWSSFNPRGHTVFIEDDIRWVHNIINQVPTLRVHQVSYNSRVSESDDLISSYRFVSQCVPPEVTLRGNSRCKLALSGMPDEVYDKEWDVILIDGPRNFFANSPGRMTVIFSAAVMARGRKRGGVTHVLVHDAHRKVDKIYGDEFLCKKYLVKTQGRLSHFAIPPDSKLNRAFC